MHSKCYKQAVHCANGIEIWEIFVLAVGNAPSVTYTSKMPEAAHWSVYFRSLNVQQTTSNEVFIRIFIICAQKQGKDLFSLHHESIELPMGMDACVHQLSCLARDLNPFFSEYIKYRIGSSLQQILIFSTLLLLLHH